MATGFTSSARKLIHTMPDGREPVQIVDLDEMLPRADSSIDANLQHWRWKQLGGISGPGLRDAFHTTRPMGWNTVNNNHSSKVFYEVNIFLPTNVIFRIKDQEIFNFHLNLREALTSDSRVNKLPSMDKNHGTFSGTKTSFLTAEENDVDDFMAWVVPFVQKMLLPKTHNVAIDLKVEHIESLGPQYLQLIQETDDIYLPISMSNIERLRFGLQAYVLRHRNSLVKDCQICFSSREHLKCGSGEAGNIQTVRGSGRRIVEVAVVIAAVSSESCLWSKNCATSQVMYFQEFTPFSVSQSSLDALTNIDWQSYGSKLKEITMDGDGNAVLEWEEMPLFGHIDIAIHYYRQRVVKTREQTSADRNLIKKAIKIALDDLKNRYPGLFLSYHALKIRKHVPDLSRTIAGLIFSSKDSQFHDECASLLGLQPDGACTEEMVESCISGKITKIIETNDGKLRAEKVNAPSLFHCDSQLGDHYPTEKDENCEEGAIIP